MKTFTEVNKHSSTAGECRSALLWSAASCGLCSSCLDLYGWANSMLPSYSWALHTLYVCVVLWWESLLDYIISGYWRFFPSFLTFTIFVFDIEEEKMWPVFCHSPLFPLSYRVPLNMHTRLHKWQLSQLTSAEVTDWFDHLRLYHHMAPAVGPLAIYNINVYKDWKTGYEFTLAFFCSFLGLHNASSCGHAQQITVKCLDFGFMTEHKKIAMRMHRWQDVFVILYAVAYTVQIFELLSDASMKLLQYFYYFIIQILWYFVAVLIQTSLINSCQRWYRYWYFFVLMLLMMISILLIP